MGVVLKKELTGYDIKKEVESSIGSFYKANYGRLYPALNKLAEKGFLTMNEQTQGKRLKKYYKTTELGKKDFLEWLSAPVDINMSGEAQLAQIFFYGELPKEIRDKRLQEYEILVQQGLQQLQNIAKTLPDDTFSAKTVPYPPCENSADLQDCCEADLELFCRKKYENMDDASYFGVSTLYYGLQNAHNTLRWLKHIREQKPFSQFLREYNEER